MNSEPYTVTGDGLISVCAWCFPGEKIFDIFPDLRGKVKLSHGICQQHLQRQKEGLCRARETVMSDGHTEPINISLECLKG